MVTLLSCQTFRKNFCRAADLRLVLVFPWYCNDNFSTFAMLRLREVSLTFSYSAIKVDNFANLERYPHSAPRDISLVLESFYVIKSIIFVLYYYCYGHEMIVSTFKFATDRERRKMR